MKKLLIFSVVAIAIIYQSGPVQASGKDDAKKAFHELMAVIDKALTEAQNALNKALDAVKKEAAELEDKAKQQLDKLLDPLRKKLDDLVAKAKAKGFDISKCQSYIDKFTQTPDDLVHNLIDCINKPIQKAQDIVNDALNNIKKIEEDLDHIDSDIDNCGGNPIKKAECYAKIIVNIAKETKDAPEKIMKDVADATALITGLVSDLETCSVNELKKAGEDAAKDVAEFGICAAVN